MDQTQEGGGSQPTERSPTFSRNEIEKIVSGFQNRRQRINVTPTNSLFQIRYIRTYERWNRDEVLYELNVQREATSSLPEFINHLHSIFSYLINVAKTLAMSRKDFVRVYFSRAPRSDWTSGLIRIEELTVERLLDVFKKHLQSSKEEILNKGWQTNVGIFVFGDDPNVEKRRDTSRRINSIYRYVNRDLSERGGGNEIKSYDPIKKHSREIRKGVFQV